MRLAEIVMEDLAAIPVQGQSIERGGVGRDICIGNRGYHKVIPVMFHHPTPKHFRIPLSVESGWTKLLCNLTKGGSWKSRDQMSDRLISADERHRVIGVGDAPPGMLNSTTFLAQSDRPQVPQTVVA